MTYERRTKKNHIVRCKRNPRNFEKIASDFLPVEKVTQKPHKKSFFEKVAQLNRSDLSALELEEEFKKIPLGKGHSNTIFEFFPLSQKGNRVIRRPTNSQRQKVLPSENFPASLYIANNLIETPSFNVLKRYHADLTKFTASEDPEEAKLQFLQLAYSLISSFRALHQANIARLDSKRENVFYKTITQINGTHLVMAVLGDLDHCKIIDVDDNPKKRYDYRALTLILVKLYFEKKSQPEHFVKLIKNTRMLSRASHFNILSTNPYLKEIFHLEHEKVYEKDLYDVIHCVEDLEVRQLLITVKEGRLDVALELSCFDGDVREQFKALEAIETEKRSNYAYLDEKYSHRGNFLRILPRSVQKILCEAEEILEFLEVSKSEGKDRIDFPLLNETICLEECCRKTQEILKKYGEDEGLSKIINYCNQLISDHSVAKMKI